MINSRPNKDKPAEIQTLKFHSSHVWLHVLRDNFSTDSLLNLAVIDGCHEGRTSLNNTRDEYVRP